MVNAPITNFNFKHLNFRKEKFGLMDILYNIIGRDKITSDAEVLQCTTPSI